MVATALQQVPSRAVAAPRRLQPIFRGTLRASVRTHSVVSDVGKYLSEAASQIFSPQTDNVPWEQGSQTFTGKIVHHQETARLKALKEAVDSAVREIESSMDEVPADVPATADEASGMGEFVMTSIQRVFGNNFTGDETEPTKWSSAGYASSGRHRSQRALRHEYERLQRFASVLESVVEKAEANKTDT